MSDQVIEDSLNHAQFQELRALLEEDFVDLLHNYMRDSVQRVEQMREALINNDNRKGFDAAHALKGATANLGATQLTKHCHDMQEACRANTIKEQVALLKQINDEVHTVNADIQKRLHPSEQL